MAISEADIKKLWGRAAGRCSKPDCTTECIPYLDPSVPTVVGEMAHVIARSSSGPRGVLGGGSDSYENLVLLCPTHHTEVDKAPAGVFPADLLLEWKRRHERRVEQAFITSRYVSRQSLGAAIHRLLASNQAIWRLYGPESDEAARNPLSSAHKIWTLRKLDAIVPNNRFIVKLLEEHQALIAPTENDAIAAFIAHAEGFEQSCYERTEGVPRFPAEFERMVRRYAEAE